MLWAGRRKPRRSPRGTDGQSPVGHFLARINIIVFPDLNVDYEIRILHLDGKLREIVQDKTAELIADSRRIHRESLVAALALDLESLIFRILGKDIFGISFCVLADRVKASLKLPGKTYRHDAEDLADSCQYVLCGILISKIRIILFFGFYPYTALALKYLKIAEPLEPVF